MLNFPKIKDRLTEDEIRQQIRQMFSTLNEDAGDATYTLGDLSPATAGSAQVGGQSFNIKDSSDNTIATGTFLGADERTASQYKDKNITAPAPSAAWTSAASWKLVATVPSGATNVTISYPIRGVVVVRSLPKKQKKRNKEHQQHQAAQKRRRQPQVPAQTRNL